MKIPKSILQSPRVKVQPSWRGKMIEGITAATLYLDLRVVSEANRRDHFRVKAHRVQSQRNAVAMKMQTMPLYPPLPVHVKLTRLAPNELDDDNLSSAFKAVRDEVAAQLGVDDGDKSKVTWEYDQKPPITTGYAIRIHIAAKAEGVEIVER